MEALKQGYQSIAGRNWSYAGDKSTWAKIDGTTLSVKKAQKGIISSEYAESMQSFCEKFGINFSSMRCGDLVKVEIEVGE